jgi:small subunit ribosomal protein S17
MATKKDDTKAATPKATKTAAAPKAAAAPKTEKKAVAPKAAAPKAEASATGELDSKDSRKDRRKLVGEVTSDKMDKTVVVRVIHRVRSTQYLKYMTKRVKYKAHDEKNEYKTGDKVEIAESRPLSRDKRWRVTRLVERAREAVQSNA